MRVVVTSMDPDEWLVPLWKEKTPQQSVRRKAAKNDDSERHFLKHFRTVLVYLEKSDYFEIMFHCL